MTAAAFLIKSEWAGSVAINTRGKSPLNKSPTTATKVNPLVTKAVPCLFLIKAISDQAVRTTISKVIIVEEIGLNLKKSVWKKINKAKTISPK